jgi:hypothetical protein
MEVKKLRGAYEQRVISDQRRRHEHQESPLTQVR